MKSCSDSCLNKNSAATLNRKTYTPIKKKKTCPNSKNKKNKFARIVLNGLKEIGNEMIKAKNCVKHWLNHAFCFIILKRERRDDIVKTVRI